MITLSEIKTQLTELYLADGYTFDEAREMVSVGEITWKGKRGKITHLNGKIDSFKISEIISFVEENEYKDPFLDSTEWLTEEEVCAPEIKANNHTAYEFLHLAIITGDYKKTRTHVCWGDQLVSNSFSWAADQTPESYAWYAFPVSTDPVLTDLNENTNRACLK